MISNNGINWEKIEAYQKYPTNQLDVIEGKTKDSSVQISAVLGCATIQIDQLLKLGLGAMVELDRSISEAIDICVNNKVVARGEIIVVDDRIGITMTEIMKA